MSKIASQTKPETRMANLNAYFCVCVLQSPDGLRLNRNDINPLFCSHCPCVFIIFNNMVFHSTINPINVNPDN